MAALIRLLEEWSDKGQILDSYAADCLAMEALQCLYGLLEDELVKNECHILKGISFLTRMKEGDGRYGSTF